MRKRKGLRVGLLIAVIALVFTACVGILGSDDSGGVPASSVEPTGSVAASVSSEVTSEPTATTAPADSLTPEPTADPTTQPT